MFMASIIKDTSEITPVTSVGVTPSVPTLTGQSAPIATEVTQSQMYIPFTSVVVTEPASGTTVLETIKVRIGTFGPHNPYPFASGDFALGTIIDPSGGGTFDPQTKTFIETTETLAGQPDAAQAIIRSLVYVAPQLTDGQGKTVQVEVSVNNSDSADGTYPISVSNGGVFTYVHDVTNPLVTAGPALSTLSGATVNPFAATTILDNGNLYLPAANGGPNNFVSARIVVSDAGMATDADGILSGAGLTKTGVGVYDLAAGYVYTVQNQLQTLAFITTTGLAITNRTDVFSLTLTDPTTGLSTTNAATSVTTAAATEVGVPVSIGTGVDALTLQISEDAYQGNAQFTISIDGMQYGGTQTAIAEHTSRQDQAFTIHGDFGQSAHTVTVDFVNDNGGYGATDRNLYVDSVSLNGAVIANSTFTEYAAGPRDIAIPNSNATTQVAPTVIGSGPDTFLFTMSEDAFEGNAQFTLSIDGQIQGGTQTATALHSMGQAQTFAVEGSFGAGAHTETINFLNDAYAGTTDTDRNLYVQGISYNGVANTDGSAALFSSGADNFNTPATAQTTLQRTLDTLTVGLTEDAYQGDARASIAINGQSLGTPTVTFLNSAGTAETFTYTGNFGGTAALQTLSVGFLNDNGGYGATDRNLYIKDISFNGTTLPDGSALYTNGTVSTTFQNNTVITAFETQH